MPDRLKELRARARKHGFTMRKQSDGYSFWDDYGEFFKSGPQYRLIPKGKTYLNSPALLPVLDPERPSVWGFCGDLDLIEVHLDWLEGNSAKVDAYLARKRQR